MTANTDHRYFLFSYFLGADNGASGLRLAVSNDGLRYRAINGGKSLLVPEVGEAKLMRDPFVIKDPNHEFYHLVWTSGWKGTEIGYASSPDLVHWSPQRSLPVMANVPGTRNCWAPEIAYDAAAGHFVIVWSSTVHEGDPTEDVREHRLYCVTTADFEEFSEPRLLLDPGFNVIDASYLNTGGRLVMFIKDERLEPEQKNIRWLDAKSPTGPFSEPSNPISPSWVEGPSALTLGNETIVFFDQYRLNRYGAVATRDFQNWYDASDRIEVPVGASHGALSEISEPTYQRLLGL